MLQAPTAFEQPLLSIRTGTAGAVALVSSSLVRLLTFALVFSFTKGGKWRKRLVLRAHRADRTLSEAAVLKLRTDFIND